MEHSSCETFSNLVRTLITDLQPNHVSFGNYLILRTIQNCIHTKCLSTIVEDHVGNLSKISLYNYFDSDSGIDVDNVLPLGTMFVLKEPLLATDEDDKVFVIRCGCPTNIILIGNNSKFHSLVADIEWVATLEGETNAALSKSSEDLKLLGNEQYKRKKFLKASVFYTFALERAESDESSLKIALNLNLAATYLHLGYFEKTLQFGQKVLEIEPRNQKALFRIGRALYELRKYSESKQNFDDVVREDTDNTEAIKEQARCNERLKEMEGKVDIYKLYLSSTLKLKSHIDFADYTGPIKIVESPGKGRGVVASQDVKPGTLLSASKAIGVSFTEAFLSVNGSHHDDNSKLVTSVALSIMKNPITFGELVYDFTSNDIDLDKNGKLFCDDLTKVEPIADIERIKRIINTNCYGVNAPDVQERILKYGESKSSVDDGSGLFRIPSYMNHSCLFNASWQTYNDIMVVFAVKPIKCGKEVFVSYFNNLHPYPLREKTCRKRNFQCFCLLCELDSREPSRIRKERICLQEKIDSCTSRLALYPGSDCNEVLSEMRLSLLQLENTYDVCGRIDLRTSLLVPYMKVALAFLRSGRIKDVLDSLDKALQAIGLDCKTLLSCADYQYGIPKMALMTPMLFHVAVLPIWGYDYVGNTKWAKMWLNALLGLEKMYVGGNVQMVKAKYKIVPEHLFK